mmetsp:Transcript_67096/g.193947  ORF Transcript_67096/g.193947 Transcript_67096/m.193947 type:complete len:201 (-) Transcript_67096:24-626(-)
MALVEQDLGGNILRRPTQCVRPCPRLHDLGETEIRQLRVPVGQQQDVLGLQVAVNDVFAVDVCERSTYLRSVKLRLLIGELPCPAQVREQLTAVDALHNDVYIVVILGVAQHVHDKRVVDLRHQPLLIVDVIHLLELDDLVLLHELNSVVLSVRPVLGKLDPAEGAASERPYHLELRQIHLFRHCAKANLQQRAQPPTCA